ncbi:MAG: ankyrin repeat domain-containing protein [Cyanobacteriota bacterium]|nr:ankyrin repeat domain-containing protein [Cyanobacteriota bacterium]
MKTLHETGEIIEQKYCILDVLGKGGSGTTYLARDLQTHQKVALKAMSLRNSGNWKLIELIEREARVLAQLSHPSIPQYLEYFQVDAPTDRTFYIAQQLAEGESLAAVVEKGWHATEQQVRAIAVQILNVLIYLHAFDPPVIHRDIKPENIILKATPNFPPAKATPNAHLNKGGWGGKLFLVDFGAVQDTYQSTLAGGSTVVGTFGYMAPEQFQGRAIPATDLYGLGATLLFLLTHRSPAELPTNRLKLDFRSRVQISEELADWLEKMLEPDAEERFASAKEALAVLQGKRQMVGGIRYISKKAIVGVGVAAIAAAFGLNYYKYAITSTFGIVPNWVNDAIAQSNTEPLQRYIQRGGNPNISLVDGHTPLHSAAEDDNLELAQLLIERGADVNVKNQKGDTPLYFAVRSGSLELARSLIERGADVNAKNQNGDTPLHAAWTWNNNNLERIKLAQLLIEHGADVNAKNQKGETPLLMTTGWDSRMVKDKQLELAQLLIEHGADVNTRTSDGTTPLHGVAQNHGVQRNNLERIKLAQLLIKHGADVNAKNRNGDPPLYEASDNPELVQLLIKHGADVNERTGNRLLYGAVWRNDPEFAQWLIERGADVNVKNQHGETPLHLTVWRNDPEPAQWLIEYGADVNVKDQKGETPLHKAASHDRQEMAQLLIERGADVNVKDREDYTPLHWAASNDSREVALLLLARGVDPNAKEKYGNTPLHWAAKHNNTKFAQLLIEHGADVNVKNQHGETPLHWAAHHNSKEVALLLIEHGADVNGKAQNGDTPVSLAAKSNNWETSELLKRYGAK